MSTVLPEEIIYNIMLFCTPATLWKLRKTCKHYASLSVNAFIKQTMLFGRQISIHPSILEGNFWKKQQVLLKCQNGNLEKQLFEFVVDTSSAVAQANNGEFLCFQRDETTSRDVREYIVTMACTCWPGAMNMSVEEMERRGYTESEIALIQRPRYRGPLFRRRLFVAIPATEGNYEYVTEEIQLRYQVKIRSANDPEVQALPERPTSNRASVVFVYFTSACVTVNWLLSGFAIGHTEVPIRPLRLY
jgi:hypothetical protein